jgi:hypothetical protein
VIRHDEILEAAALTASPVSRHWGLRRFHTIHLMTQNRQVAQTTS